MDDEIYISHQVGIWANVDIDSYLHLQPRFQNSHLIFVLQEAWEDIPSSVADSWLHQPTSAVQIQGACYP